ncbi:hypothetical protein DL764_001407 [Monosporascus ibericus]|uniref:Autophagy-related protein 1 n=1 Tax=Monosporascus ibericus TaxID=155417 RepID=A0A4Q4TPL1_9PEZI|nr:hypothetical protein DL764_001407 [Monosporascus ibericus]
MDQNDGSQATQQATQNALDPRRIGKQNSGFSDEEISDIVCLLYPNTENASSEVQRLANSPEYSRFTVGRYTADNIDSDLYLEDDARNFGRTRGVGDHAIVLRLSASVKDPAMGFTFGRNPSRCDIAFTKDQARRLSNVHFRIFVNEHGSVMLEDQSTNGTVVDGQLLRKSDRERHNRAPTRTLESGSTIKIIMVQSAKDLLFLVRIPRRDGETEALYTQNLETYLRRLHGRDEDPNKTIRPGPSGHGKRTDPPANYAAHSTLEKKSREWRGGDKYNRVGVIGKGAFATVYKVTSRYDGSPYAAKELDKRKFMKNGVLDQKVENEMRIMQKVQHANIVQYIEHFDWDAHQFIIIMEYVPLGDLGKLVQDHGSIREPHVKIMADQLIDALGYLHDNKITHRDVKPDNILIQSLDPLVVKLTDFGLSKMIDTEQTFLKTFCGTLLYCAPEVYNEYASYDDLGRKTHRRNQRIVDRERYDHAVDIWSLGGVLFYALTSRPPFPVRNGVTYTELLDHIIKTPLNTLPLVSSDVSRPGIEFLCRMIHVRPETRATIAELQAHPWLNSLAQSFDEISDEELGQGASQLSLDDRQRSPEVDLGASALQEPDLSMEYESEKENYTFGQRTAQNRLFGEVNNSALGSSGAVAEEQLNLPISNASSGETEILEPVIRDSFEGSDDLSTPRQKRPLTQSALTESQVPFDGNTRSILLGFGSQSLGGASSIFGNLNMTSPIDGESSLQSLGSDFTASKRKPAYDTSDEYDTSGTRAKPSMKRLKSQGDVNLTPEEEEDEYTLLASVPPLPENLSGRQIDYPLHKTTFWDSQDKKSWHLDYPEMTHSQYNAFERAAERRNEEFGPGKSPLWDLAMRDFPPTRHRSENHRPLELRPALLKRDSRLVGQTSDLDLPSTAPLPAADDDDLESIPDTLPPETQAQPTLQGLRTPKTVVATFRSAPGSLVPGISFSLVDPVLSWGRERHNTIIYQPATESKVPKNAFRVLLWRDGYNASLGDFRPWELSQSTSSRTLRVSPAPDSYAFYISTKATNGLRLNNSPLPPNEPKDNTAPCKYWMKLYHGDTISFWGTEDVNYQAKLTFECFWGSSAVSRPPDDPPVCAPDTTARKLDRLWQKAFDNLSYDRIKSEAHVEHEVRLRQVAKEQERSRVFEQKRAEAVRILSLRASRGTTPASAPPVSRTTQRPGKTAAQPVSEPF